MTEPLDVDFENTFTNNTLVCLEIIAAMQQEGRCTRAAKDAVLRGKPWVEGEGAQPNTSQQPPKQARITDTFPVRKGPCK